MNIFTRKKVLLAANRTLALCLRYERDERRDRIGQWARRVQALQEQVKELESKVREPYKVILVDEREGVGKDV